MTNDAAAVEPWKLPEQQWRTLVNHVRAGRTLRPRSGRAALATPSPCPSTPPTRPTSWRIVNICTLRQRVLSSEPRPREIIYLVCEDGATVDEAHDTLRASGRVDLSQEEIREFLDELTNVRLVYAEGGLYLALALPWRLPEAA